MNNKKEKGKGIGKVYAFTLTQLYKNKANRVVFGILIFICLISVPVGGLLLGDVDLFGGIEPGADSVSVYTQTMTYEEYLEQVQDNVDSRMAVQNIFSILLLMLITFSISYIIRAIIDEKSSKLVELLMVSIPSEALIFGKILAVMTFIFSMLLATIAALAVSFFVSGIFIDTSFVGGWLTGNQLSPDQLGVGLEILPVVLISMVLAYFLFSLISALAGAGCSTIEEMDGAYLSVLLLLLLGYIVPTSFGPFLGNGFRTFLSLFPLTAPFACPTSYLMGDISIWIVVISWAIQIAVLFLIYKVSGKVYDRLIIYKGARIKLSAIFKMAAKKGKEAA